MREDIIQIKDATSKILGKVATLAFRSQENLSFPIIYFV